MVFKMWVNIPPTFINTFDKHVGKMKTIWDMPHLGKKERDFYMNKKCKHAKNEVTYS
jgi:hypothetical protein